MAVGTSLSVKYLDAKVSSVLLFYLKAETKLLRFLSVLFLLLLRTANKEVYMCWLHWCLLVNDLGLIL